MKTANTHAHTAIDDLLKVIQKYAKFDGVWHFTDRANLESIQQHGLLSLAESGRRNITIPAPGGNEWSHNADRRKGLDEYVHLAFIRDHPMLYAAQNEESRILNPVWLKIELSVLSREDVLFTPDVANKRSIHTLTTQQATAQIDFDALFAYLDWTDPEVQRRRQAAKKSVRLMPNCIPWEKVVECHDG